MKKRDRIRNLVIEAITDTTKLTDIVDKLMDIDEPELSDCCGSEIYEETDICTKCKEHC